MKELNQLLMLRKGCTRQQLESVLDYTTIEESIYKGDIIKEGDKLYCQIPNERVKIASAGVYIKESKKFRKTEAKLKYKFAKKGDHYRNIRDN